MRFESYITTLDPNLKTIAPVREWSMGRNEQIFYAEKNNIPISQSIASPYSYDENIWGNTAEGAEIESPEKLPVLEKILKWCTLPEKSCYKNQLIKIDFENGVAKKLDGEILSQKEIIHKLNKIGAQHGIGILPMIEDRIFGLKIRGVYEQPAAEILITAHKNLEQLVSTATELKIKKFLDAEWAGLTYAAKWFDPATQKLNHAIQHFNQKITGSVTLKLYKGNCTVMAIDSPHSLLNPELATFDFNEKFNQNASAGFIELYSLTQKTAHQLANF